MVSEHKYGYHLLFPTVKKDMLIQNVRRNINTIIDCLRASTISRVNLNRKQLLRNTPSDELVNTFNHTTFGQVFH